MTTSHLEHTPNHLLRIIEEVHHRNGIRLVETNVRPFDVLIDTDPARYAEWLAGPYAVRSTITELNELTVVIQYTDHSDGVTYVSLLVRDVEGDFLNPSNNPLLTKTFNFRPSDPDRT